MYSEKCYKSLVGLAVTLEQYTVLLKIKGDDHEAC